MATNPAQPTDGFNNAIINSLTMLCDFLKDMIVKRPAYMNIPKYAGEDKESYEQWAEKFQSSSFLHNWPEQKQILLLHQALTDRVIAYYQSIYADSKKQFQAFFKH